MPEEPLRRTARFVTPHEAMNARDLTQDNLAFRTGEEDKHLKYIRPREARTDRIAAPQRRGDQRGARKRQPRQGGGGDSSFHYLGFDAEKSTSE